MRSIAQECLVPATGSLKRAPKFERDHRLTKQRIRPRLGFKQFETATVTIRGMDGSRMVGVRVGTGQISVDHARRWSGIVFSGMTEIGKVCCSLAEGDLAGSSESKIAATFFPLDRPTTSVKHYFQFIRRHDLTALKRLSPAPQIADRRVKLAPSSCPYRLRAEAFDRGRNIPWRHDREACR